MSELRDTQMSEVRYKRSEGRSRMTDKTCLNFEHPTPNLQHRTIKTTNDSQADFERPTSNAQESIILRIILGLWGIKVKNIWKKGSSAFA